MSQPPGGDGAVRDLLTRAAPGILRAPVDGTVFWTGAGISADAPTGAPLGTGLVDRALGHCFAARTPEIIESCYRALRVPRSRPRLETVLDVVRRVHGLPVLADVLSDLRHPPPNGCHEFLAAHANVGGGHITANFDPCLELAAAAAGGCQDVLHFHGSFATGDDGDSLGATLARIERGFPAELSDRLTGVLTAKSWRLLVFVGYSGSDFFDVDPYLEQLAAAGIKLAGTALWVEHDLVPPLLRSGPAAVAARPQLGALHRAGMQVHQITAPARSVLTALAAAWQLPPPAPAHGVVAPWRPTVRLTEASRQEAALELFALMGLHREVLSQLTRRGGPASSREWEIAAQSSWAAGQYRRAGAAWQRAWPGDSPAAQLARQERRGACQWIRGQYSRAYRTLSRAVQRGAAAPADLIPPDLRIQTAETLGRVWVHMGRTPDTRWLATERRRAFVLSQLPHPGATGASRLGTHLQARIRSVRADLGAPDTSGEPWQTSQLAFAEYEALHSRLNYRHAELRHTAAPPAAAFRELQRDFHALGAYGDASRVPLIPGAETAFTVRESLRGFREIDITWWHRLRLSGGYLAKRLLAAVPRHRPG